MIKIIIKPDEFIKNLLTKYNIQKLYMLRD